MKLLILPSYSEGLPAVILEAMACGTPVLATSVGGITHLIDDTKTGFIMEDNFPETIARNVTRALKFERLDELAQNARSIIEKEFTYDVSEEKWKMVLQNISKSADPTIY